MARWGGWTIGIVSIAPALLAHAGCAGRSVSHVDEAGGSSATGTGGTNAAGRSNPGVTVDPRGPMLDPPTIPCSASLDNRSTPDPAAVDFMNKSCAKNFCHGKNFVVGLDLRLDQGFAQRLLDVPAQHQGIPCPDDVTQECIPESCPAPGTVKLIDSGDPMASWLLTTTLASHQSCGDRMPDQNGLTPDEDACLTAIVNATAALK